MERSITEVWSPNQTRNVIRDAVFIAVHDHDDDDDDDDGKKKGVDFVWKYSRIDFTYF
jgi:hypothetical protein